MKSRFWFSTALLVLTILTNPTSLLAQWPSDSQQPGMRSPGQVRVATLTGVVKVEGSSDPASDASVILQCGTEVRGRANVDNKGTFALELNVMDPANDVGQSTPLSPPQKAGLGMTSAAPCELHGEASGYRSEPLHLAGEQLEGIVQVGTIVLRSNSPQPRDAGFTVSAASLAAPDGAKKAFLQGQQQARKGKWAAACDYFRRALEVYPRFALAWLELGRAQVQQNNFVEAEHSFQQATTHDSNLTEAYVEQARLAIQQKQWKELADATDHIVAQSPESSALPWFFNAVARFNLGDVAHAESSAAHGLRLDSAHKVPQLEYLYGMILAREQNYKSASEHLKTYLQIAPQAPDAGEAQRKLADLEKLSSQASPGAGH